MVATTTLSNCSEENISTPVRPGWRAAHIQGPQPCTEEPEHWTDALRNLSSEVVGSPARGGECKTVLHFTISWAVWDRMAWESLNWECHMLARQEPVLPKRKSVTESALLPSSTNIAQGEPLTRWVTPSFLFTLLPSPSSQYSLVSYL